MLDEAIAARPLMRQAVTKMRKPAVVLLCVYVVISLLFVSPLVNYGALTSASYEGDSRLVMWILAWDAHAMLTWTPLFQANMYYPELATLGFIEHCIGLGIFALPVYFLTGNPVLTYWILWLATFPLNAVAMHALALRVTRHSGAAFTAGCVFAFCFFRMHHAHGHVQLLWTWMMPLVPLALENWLERPTARNAASLAALVLLTALTSWYLAVFVGVLGLSCVVWLVRPSRVTKVHALQAIVGGCMVALVLAWFARPYLALSAGPTVEASENAADWKSYLVPPENTLAGQVLSQHTRIRVRWIWGEQTLYIGLSVVALAGLGAYAVMRRKDTLVHNRRVLGAVLTAGAVGLVLSFGPSPSGMLPFDLAARMPGLSLLRAPARFALLVMLAAALLSAVGVRALLLSRFGRLARLGVGAALVLFFVESFVVAFPAGKPARIEVPPAYHLLARLPPGAILSLPSYRDSPEAFREADYLLFSTVHWRPIVNGGGRQEPPHHGSRMTVLSRFPDDDAISLMRELRIRYVVLHTRRSAALDGAAQEARALASVRLVYSGEGDYVFEVR
jgi:hypothetical protein